MAAIIAMTIRDHMWWYKYQPRNLNNIILLPRIRSLVKDGIKMNMVFYSDTAGTGKSTLARILCNDTDGIEFNASEDTSVNILRNQLGRHCKTANPFAKTSQKTIFLDEFDGVSDEYKKAMKGFSDKYEYVRFILTTNHIEDIGDKILSRFTKIDFTPNGKEEIDYLHEWYLKYLKVIASKNDMSITDDELMKIILISFPDLRSATVVLQTLFHSNNKSIIEAISTSGVDDIFMFLMDGKNNIVDNYNFVMNNFQDKPLELMKTLGRPLFKRIMSMDHVGLIKKGATIVNLQKLYNERYNETIDPLIHLVSYVTDIKEVLMSAK